MDDRKAPGRWKNWRNGETGIFLLTLVFIAALHRVALQDRFTLLVFTLLISAAAYLLVRRRALGFAASVFGIMTATIFAQTYYSTRPENWHPWIDAIRDMAGLGILMLICVRLLVELYRYQQQEKDREIRRIMEKKIVAMRAAALRSTSHEVRTPLSTISAITETLLSDSIGPLTEEQREFVTDIDDAAQHLMSLVNDILDFAKAEAGMISLVPETVALVELVDQCVSMIDTKAQAAEITISAQVSPDLKEIVADPLRLKQILLNLLSNAIKYNDQGGSVVVRVRPDERDMILISVRDTGRGIEPQHVEHLFDPYYQAAITDQGIGTGLGLAIIKHLTELHGGNVTVESVVGLGSVFLVRLPRVAQLASSTAEPLMAGGSLEKNLPKELRELVLAGQ